MRLTLCTIARDESQFLPGCLESVRGVVDELVVVDTGSTDDTVALARAAGAIVVERPWDDDFAAARNAALEVATGDFVLVLDADERLAPGAGPALRAALTPGFVLGLLPLHDATTLEATAAEVLSGERRKGDPVWLPRLFRRTPDLRWEGRVHETVSAWLLRHGGRVTQVDAALVHYGAVPEVRAARAKGQRNLRLLELLCAEHPESPVPFGYLASERFRAGDPAGARAAADAGWEALRAAFAAGRRPAVVSLATVRAQLALMAEDPAAAAATVDEARAMTADHPNLAFVAGQAAALGGDLHRAVDELATALSGRGGRFAEPVVEGATGVPCRLLLAKVHRRLEQPDDALLHWLLALDEDPGCAEAALAAAELHLDGARPDEALRVLDGHMTTGDAWTLAAAALLARGDVESARVFAGRAPGCPWVEVGRKVRWQRVADAVRARSGRFAAGPGAFGTLGALIAGQPLATPSPVDDATVALVVDALVDRGDEAGLDRLRTRRAEVLVPGLRARMDAHLASRDLSWTDADDGDFVFVGGAGRSGTTLFRAMLTAHPNLWCPPERKLVPVLADLHARAEKGLSADLREAGVDEAVLDRAARAWLEVFLRAGAPPGRRVAEKTPHDLLHTAWLGRVFPRARFVHVLRDGRAVAESLVRQRWVDPSTGELVAWCRDLESAAAYWASVVQVIRSQAASVPGRFLEVRFEELTEDPRPVMERVLAFLGEPWDEAVLHHERSDVALSPRESSSAAVAGAMDGSRAAAWRRTLSPDDQLRVSRAVGPVLEATGYVS
jgi:tetratricopeptide (TPR) repeat protein